MKEQIIVAKEKARKKVTKNKKFQFFSRFGFAIRGLVYFLLGLLGLEFSAGLREQGAGFTEAIIFIQKQPFGQLLLIAVIIGFIAYSLWSFLRAFLNITKEEGKIGLIINAGYLGSAVSYGALAISTWLFFRGFSIKADTEVQKELASKILYLGHGKILLILVGTIWAIAGIAQVFIAVKEKFKKNLKISEMSDTKEGVGVWLGKIGIISRGIIFLLIGIFLIKAALLLDPSKVLGTEEVMEFIKAFTFGPILLGIVSSGLMIFGVFSVFQGVYFKFPSE